MAREYLFRGQTIAQLKELSVDDFIKLLPARQRRSYKRGWTYDQEEFLKKLRSGKEAKGHMGYKTHARDMIVLPEMVGRKVSVYNGKEFKTIELEPEMVGHFLGEFSQTRKTLKHSAAGIGATRSTKFISVK